jgi:hypothetical protein
VSRQLQGKKLREATSHEPCVYFMQFGAGQPIKIGFTTNIGARLLVIRAAHWQEPTVLCALAGDRKLERRMHVRFAAHRIGMTEWFRPAPALLQVAKETEDSGELAETLVKSIEMCAGAEIDTLYEDTRKSRAELVALHGESPPTRARPPRG